MAENDYHDGALLYPPDMAVLQEAAEWADALECFEQMLIECCEAVTR